MIYLWLKAAHIASVLVFIGGLFALLHVCAALDRRVVNGPDQTVALKAAILLWDRRITVPAMAALWGFGLWTASSGDWFSSVWLQAKLVLVVVLSGLHGVIAGRLRRHQDDTPADERHLQFPILAIACASVLGVVLLAVVKPG